MPEVDFFVFGKFTLDDFLLAEAFLGVAVADPVAGLNPGPQASLVAPDDLFPLRDTTGVNAVNIADTQGPQSQILWVTLKTKVQIPESENRCFRTCAVLRAYRRILALDCITETIRTCPQVRGAGGVVPGHPWSVRRKNNFSSRHKL